MPVDKNEVDPEIEFTDDKLHRFVCASLGLLPYGSGTAVELFAALVAPPLERRKQKWMIDVKATLQALEGKDAFTLSELFVNEEFLSTQIDASAAAIKSHEDEKLTALRAAVLNSAMGCAPELAKRQLYMRYVTEFTVWHPMLLDLFNGSVAWGKRHGVTFPNLYAGGRIHVLDNAYPELKGERAFYDQVWADLNSRGLTSTNSLHGMMTGGGIMEACTSDSGKEFLSFVTEPT